MKSDHNLKKPYNAAYDFMKCEIGQEALFADGQGELVAIAERPQQVGDVGLRAAVLGSSDGV